MYIIRNCVMWHCYIYNSGVGPSNEGWLTHKQQVGRATSNLMFLALVWLALSKEVERLVNLQPLQSGILASTTKLDNGQARSQLK